MGPTMNVSPIQSPQGSGYTPAAPTPSTGSHEFSHSVAQRLSEVNQLQLDADAAVEQLATGQTDNVNDVVLSMAKADLSFRLVLEIRNRLIESYQEIMRMQI